jgi:hypothetical protein
MTTDSHTAAPRTDDPYTRTLLDLRVRQRALSAALTQAKLRTGPAERAAALSELHVQIRGMAALANDALGGWPESEPDPQ